MKLYHYTNLECFLRIWQKKILLFSKSHKTTNNDFFEKRKIFNITGDCLSVTRQEWDLFSDNVDKFLQISLNHDYEDLEGCLSSMMWGQYADNGNGVCIELDSDKLKIQEGTIWSNMIEYLKMHPKVDVDANIIKDPTSHVDFIVSHIDDIFFKKQRHWAFENEFRLISNTVPFLDIKDAIVSIHVPNNCGHTSFVVRKVVGDDSKVKYIIAIPTDEGMVLKSIPFR